MDSWILQSVDLTAHSIFRYQYCSLFRKDSWGRGKSPSSQPCIREKLAPCLDSGRAIAIRTTEEKSEIFAVALIRGSSPWGEAWANIKCQKRKVSLRRNLLCIYSSGLGNLRHLNLTAACTLFHSCNGEKKKSHYISLGTHTNLLNAFQSGSNS